MSCLCTLFLKLLAHTLRCVHWNITARYHCIEPSGSTFLNTFIERPWVQARLLYWWASVPVQVHPAGGAAGAAAVERQAAHASRAAGAAVGSQADGWLYYATDLWRPHPGKQKAPIRRLAGADGRSGKTDFDPSNYIWAPRTDIFANGDGMFVYPGPEGKPIGSARLANVRDAIEDRALLRMAAQAHAKLLKRLESRQESDLRALAQEVDPSSYIRKLVRSPTDHTDDPELLERSRRAVAEGLGRAAALLGSATSA